MKQSSRILETYVAIRGRLTRMVTCMVPFGHAEDIVQETYVRVTQSNSKSIRGLNSYFFRTASNLVLDHIFPGLKRTEQVTSARAMADEAFEVAMRRV